MSGIPVEGGSCDVHHPADQVEPKGRGRTRYCKKCSFTCTDAREFTAHQASHSDVTGDTRRDRQSSPDATAACSPAPSSTASTVAAATTTSVEVTTSTSAGRTRRSLRSSRNSRSSVSDMAPPPAPGPDVASGTDSSEKTSLSQSKVDREAKDTGDSNVAADTSNKSEGGQTASAISIGNSDNNVKTIEKEFEEEKMEEEEGDEPDSMMTMSKDNIDMSVAKKTETPNMQNGNSGYVSGDEEMEDEGKLVIADDKQEYVKHRELPFSTPLNEEMTDTIDLTAKSPAEKGNESDINFLGVESQNSSRIVTPYDSSVLLNEVDGMEEDDDRRRDHGVSMMPGSVPLTITTDNIDQVLDDDKKKKKKTRQEVDPGKYFEAVDGSGTKYACSQCGNIYKWRKSLNKHWKEKHMKDPLVEEPSPPGMLELLKSGKYTQLGARRIYDNAFLATIKTQKDDNQSRPPSSPGSDGPSPGPPNFLATPQNMSSLNASRFVASVASAMMPKMIGPFVANSAQPVFPGMPIGLSHLSLQNGFDNTEEGALDLTRDSIKMESGQSFSMMSSQNMSSSFDQDQPLDFSKKNGEKVNSHIKNEKLWDEMNNSMKQGHSMTPYIPKVHRCSKCDYTSTSEVDFANHTSSHLNKRIVRCFECKLQLNSMDELNSHFMKLHNKKLADHKEAIKKIPHGLQQTYHLLQMDIDKIGDLGSQDLGATDSKSLKCKKCDFEAKWPAELQKHAVSHSEERPYICMVCGSTYKWKWDLVKHFQKSHPNLPNPYRRNDKRESPDASSEEELEEEPEAKRARYAMMTAGAMNGAAAFNRDDAISVEGIIAATQAGQRFVSSQPHLDDESGIETSHLAFLNAYPYLANGENVPGLMERHSSVQRAVQESSKKSSSSKKTPNKDQPSPGSSSSSSRNEELPYKCTMCNYHARWPSEVTQHMKNHSDSKPYLCPRCEYRSKWKWDVVKHLKRCGGGGGIDDVIDTTKPKRRDNNSNTPTSSATSGPPNAVVSQQGKVKKTTPQPPMAYIMPSVDENGQPSAVVLRPSHGTSGLAQSMAQLISSDDQSRSRSSSASLDNSNNNDSNVSDNNFNNNYALYSSGQSLPSVSPSMPVPSATFTPITPSIANNSPAPSPATHTTSSRQNSNAEVWPCPHCAFTTQSQAELKRHSGLHSEDKPFKCDVCHYSTRWACDLKKHRRSYNHFPQNKGNVNSNNTSPDKSPVVKDTTDKSDKVVHRFKCFQCNIFFPQLQNLLEHRKSTHIGRESAQSSPAPQTEENEIDAARIKHPRKQMRQISCPKCPFVCRNRNTMDRHMEEHEIQEMNAHTCFYCPQQYKDKESLLDHIISHPMFNPKEWETFFMINEDEEEEQVPSPPAKAPTVTPEVQQPKKDNSEAEKQTAKVMKELEKVNSKSEATEARIQQILDEIPKQQKQSQSVASVQARQPQSKYKCEWCPAEFVNLTAVYKHASQAHPIQLKEQDVSMTLASQSAQQKAQISQEMSPKKVPYAGEPIEILRQQIAEKRNQQMMEKFNELFTTNPKLQEVLSKKMEEEKSAGGKRFQCDKCSFASSNLVTFQRHYELHGSKLQSQCWFCDYSVDRMNLLYQHMKISHTRKWKALSQDPKYASQIHKMNLAFANTSSQGNNVIESNVTPEPTTASVISGSVASGAMDLSAKASKSPSEMAHDIMYQTRLQYTWSGIPVNVIPVGSALNFVCPNCSYNDTSIAKTCSHVMQSHRAMTKFKCKTCSFSDDNIHVMSDHCKTSHPILERVVEVIDFKQLNFSELQMVQLNAMKERMDQGMNAALNAQEPLQGTTAAKKLMSCPFCPYKCYTSEEMKSHLSNHSKQARYRCQLCDFSSDLTNVISDHVKVHDPSYASAKSQGESAEMNAVRNLSSPARRADPTAVHPKEEPELEVKVKVDEVADTEGPRGISNAVETLKEGSPKIKSAGRIRYRCSVCPYHTTCKSNILKHKRQHLHNKRYKCSKCSYSAARAVLLKNHLDAHDMPVEEDGLHHDIFCNPNSPSDDLRSDNDDNDNDQEAEMDVEDGDDDDTNSDDLENEMDAKAIADLEAKDIMEAEAAHKASILLVDELGSNGENAGDKPLRRQKCPHCPFSSNSAYEFRKHLNFHGTQERYKCDRCSYSLDRLNLLSQHRKLHCEEPGYNPNPPASDLLNTSFILQQNTDTKYGTHSELGADLSSDQYVCDFCPYKATKKSLLVTHMNSHAQKKRFICDYCDWSADRLELVQQHRRVHENEPDFNLKGDEKGFLNKEFDDGGSGEFEAKYMEIKSAEKSVKEGENESSTSPPFKLTVVKKSYPCRLCPFKTNSRNSYSVHKSMHGSCAEFSCPECSYSVSSRGLLQQHMHLHSTTDRGEATSPQPPTSKSTPQTTPKSLQACEPDAADDDEAINLSSKSSTDCKTPPNQSDQKVPASSQMLCSFCPFTTTSANALAEHVKIHPNQDKLTCPHCSYCATSTNDLYPHLQTHFPDTSVEKLISDQKVAETLTNNNNNNNNNNLSSPPVEGKNNLIEQEKSELTPTIEKVAPTRIYVCRYCDREFEAKALMLQHEKQHLVGT
ncbi:uncharacterized protein LOC101854480 [Aplysia californica]|uniref:Uncharacterized protein LOC101854480 n=1 Tax=Aplysia californica TaxID=6500 RepID=A0ABM0ZV79_APLCA|nr:uncharacterized protein LOC101854480 [Aplysia californica]XP_005093303.1 uncharacterized protein LOC101854480 [Aplysia californica]XP_012935153.1 uncharacterized protein LOC101854480 [Aplysia californica]